MSIRNGAFLDKNGQPIPEFMDMVREYEKRLEYARKNTFLPDEPNYAAINEFMISVHEKIVNESIHYDLQHEDEAYEK